MPWERREKKQVEEVRSPSPLVIRGKPYPPTFHSLDRAFVLASSSLVNPFEQLAQATCDALPFMQLTSAQREQPELRARTYYASIEQLCLMQSQLAEFGQAICFSSIVRSSNRRREMASFEKQFAKTQIPDVHPISCPVLDVEQNAKQPPAKIERIIVDGLRVATRSLAYDALHMMHHLVGREVMGRIDFFDNAGCRFFFYENEVIRGRRWPTLQVREMVNVHSSTITSSAPIAARVQRLVRTIPPWLLPLTAIVSGTKIKSTTVLEETTTDQHLPACTTYALVLGSYVFTGWSVGDMSWHRRWFGGV